MRGELPNSAPYGLGDAGSSPHAWGTPVDDIRNILGCRFIPTCVGNSYSVVRVTGNGSVHPHMRGELLGMDPPLRTRRGSSPHAWGTRHPEGGQVHRSRFIPTCVGNSPRRTSGVRGRPVHPHMRGELRLRASSSADRTGSSPHAWGTLILQVEEPENNRFIPTCVGNSSIRWGPPGAPAVHPHMRGELAGKAQGPAVAFGSSPHAWGTLFRYAHRGREDRFIPTCVGNSQVRGGQVRKSAVHPHMRGELSSPTRRVSSSAGSSPHAWGTRVCSRHRRLPQRFIPTCVGNSLFVHLSPPAHPVHPHMRGELVTGSRSKAPRSGSSPHAWGTPVLERVPALAMRFIPTCVGNSFLP